jgi:CDP-6-deoxy-D-xylo-4-hexulose-3-dehydrase
VTFRPGIDPIPVSGKVYDDAEIEAGCRAVKAGCWTAGPETAAFERELAQFVGVRSAMFVNSGSSANLAAISALTSTELGEARLNPGDEVITCAVGFPTTVNPIIQNGLVPVFVDARLPTYNLDESQLESAWSERTRAVVVAHTLGNPANLLSIDTKHIGRTEHLWMVEDCCDALGSVYSARTMAGQYGSMATFSFYPAHQMTTGEGGAVVSDNPKLMKLARSFAGWGRDCWCDPGKDNTCGQRFNQQHGELPHGYDHKYTYSHVGYNLKSTDIQAAIGREQLKKLPAFIEARKRNHAALYAGLKPLEEFFILPEEELGSDPAWFGFALTVRNGTPYDAHSPFTRADIVRHLESRKIATRPIFAGNLTRQPAYIGVGRKVGELPVADKIMRDSFWIGCWPGLGPEHTDYMVESVIEFVKAATR